MGLAIIVIYIQSTANQNENVVIFILFVYWNIYSWQCLSNDNQVLVKFIKIRSPTMMTSWDISKNIYNSDIMFNFGTIFAKPQHELKILNRILEKFLHKELSTSWSITFNKVCLKKLTLSCIQIFLLFSLSFFCKMK